MVLRCPVCKAENGTPPTCRRCKADLSLSFALEQSREDLLARARLALKAERWDEALELALGVAAMRQDDESGQLVAVASLLCGDYFQAWRSYQRLRGNLEEDRSQPGR